MPSMLRIWVSYVNLYLLVRISAFYFLICLTETGFHATSWRNNGETAISAFQAKYFLLYSQKYLSKPNWVY